MTTSVTTPETTPVAIIESFADLALKPTILNALTDLGYEIPTPIQQESIPLMMAGKDVLAQAQTGTGKTAAFAVPILANINLDKNYPQALILAPTRELAIQVAQAIKAYAKHMSGFRVLPIYGGQEYRTQLRALERGPHVIVGTPGRVMDHLRRKTLSITNLKMLVLDEADEMLKMGFQEDVEWILEQINNEHLQTALFSATIPSAIKKVVDKYLKNPQKIHIKTKTTTVDTIEQFYTIVSHHHKLEALTRFLEAEEIDGMLIFSRTKIGSTELAERLEALGFAAAAMNGDMNQSQREKVIARLKKGGLDIVVATEVAARGLDVKRISHVVNYDAPFDAESYTHRIGRTGRAGRKGKSFLFVTPKERRIIHDIERTTRQPMTAIDPPSYSQINKKRTDDFNSKLLGVLAKNDLDFQREYIEQFIHANEHSELDVAAALASMIKDIKPRNERADEQKFVDEAPANKKRRRSPPGSSSSFKPKARFKTRDDGKDKNTDWRTDKNKEKGKKKPFTKDKLKSTNKSKIKFKDKPKGNVKKKYTSKKDTERA